MGLPLWQENANGDNVVAVGAANNAASKAAHLHSLKSTEGYYYYFPLQMLKVNVLILVALINNIAKAVEIKY